MRRRKFQKAAARKKKEARESAARALQKTKARFGIDAAGSLKGAMRSPLATDTQRRAPKTAPTSDRIPVPRPPRISSTNTSGSKEPKKLRLQCERCVGKANRLLGLT